MLNRVDAGGAASKTAVLAKLLASALPNPVSRILVVGCGNGFDAGVLARAFGAKTIGIDIYDIFDPAAGAPAEFMQMDARALTFEDNNFDFVYSFHALEHIPEPQRALAEMNRVLRPGGVYCVGTPNRTRAIGYLSVNASWHAILAQNLADWRARLRGRFRNEYGAHAGFSGSELKSMCEMAFGQARNISDQYYSALYSLRPFLMRFVIGVGLQAIAWPSVYITGSKL
jgi:SAM-dependent methyltransferase